MPAASSAPASLSPSCAAVVLRFEPEAAHERLKLAGVELAAGITEAGVELAHYQ